MVVSQGGSFSYRNLLLATVNRPWRLTMPAYEVGASQEYHSWRSKPEELTDLRELLTGFCETRFVDTERHVIVEATTEGVLYRAGTVKLVHGSAWTLFLPPGPYITKRDLYVQVPVTEEQVGDLYAILNQWKEVPRG